MWLSKATPNKPTHVSSILTDNNFTRLRTHRENQIDSNFIRVINLEKERKEKMRDN